MTIIRQSWFKRVLLVSALAASLGAHAQNAQWQLQINSQQPAPPPAPVQALPPGAYAVQPPVPAQPSVEQIQAQQDARIRWAAQRGYMSEQDFRRLQQMQGNIEHNRRIAYSDGVFYPQEQQFLYGQLNLLTVEIDTLMLNNQFAFAYFQQFNTPVQVWVLNQGWVSGRYDIRADSHLARAYRPAPKPPVVQQPVPQGHPSHRQLLREVLDPLGLFR